MNKKSNSKSYLNPIFLLNFIFCLSLGFHALHAQTDNQIIFDSLTVELSKLAGKKHINGFGVAIVDAEKTLYQKGFGFANKQQQTPYTIHTVQNIASISKTFLGIALLKAEELGKLKLDDPINKYLPFEVSNPRYPEVPITIRQLSTHTSSIIDTKIYDQKSYVLVDLGEKTKIEGSINPGNFNEVNSHTTMGIFLEKVLSKNGNWYQKKGFLKSKPGERFNYSNVGATLAAYVLEKATGESYKSFSKKHILNPLQMNSSGWSFKDIDIEKHSILYESVDNPFNFYTLITYPDGGLITSVHDLAIYLNELIKGYSGRGILLSQKSYKVLFETQLEDVHFEERNADNAYNDEYNMGVFMGFSAKGNIGHTGGDPGVTTLMFFNESSKKGQLILVNTDFDEKGFDDFKAVWKALEAVREKL